MIVGAIWSVWHYWAALTPAGGHLSEFVSSGFSDGVGLRTRQFRPDSVALQQYWGQSADRVSRTCRTHGGLESRGCSPYPIRLVHSDFLGGCGTDGALWHQFHTERSQ